MHINIKSHIILLTYINILYMFQSTKSTYITEVMTMEAYCFKCRKKVTIANPESVTLKNGRPATRGTCPACPDTKVFRIGKA